MEEKHTFYRYVDYLVSTGVDEWENPLGPPSVSIRLLECPVLSFTPKGAWILDRYGNKRFVLSTANKRYACATKEEALESFQARKKRQAAIYSNRARLAEEALALSKGDTFL